jgi:hypothetical protein
MDKKIHLFDVVGVTATNSYFIIRQAFLSHEATEDNRWLEWIQDFYTTASNVPKSITTDKAGASAKAVEIVFPNVPFPLCPW